MVYVYALIITSPGRMDSFGNQESDNYSIHIFSTMALAQHHAQNCKHYDIRTIQVDDPNDTIDI